MRLARDSERRHECAFAAIFHRALELFRGGLGIAERQMRDRHKPSAGVAAEIRDPSIVGAAVSLREFGVEKFRLPQEPDGRVEQRLRHALFVDELDALLRVHGAEGRALHVGLFGQGTHRARVFGANLAAHHRLAQLLRLVDVLTHSAERAEHAGLGHLGALADRFRDIRSHPRRPGCASRARDISGRYIFPRDRAAPGCVRRRR